MRRKSLASKRSLADSSRAVWLLGLVACSSSTAPRVPPARSTRPPARECKTTSDHDEFSPRVVGPSSVAPSTWGHLPACPRGTRRMMRDIGVGPLDPMSITEIACERSDGTRHGPYTAFATSAPGTVLQRGRYEHGVRQGTWVLRDLGGQGQRKGPYSRGAQHGVWESRHPNGRVAWRGRFECGQRVGTFRWWYPDGGLLQEGRLVKNLPEGTWREYWSGGALKAEGTWRAGVKVGTWSFWDRQGKPIANPD